MAACRASRSRSQPAAACCQFLELRRRYSSASPRLVVSVVDACANTRRGRPPCQRGGVGCGRPRSCCCTGSRARSTTGPVRRAARAHAPRHRRRRAGPRRLGRARARSRSPRPCGSWATPIDQIGVERPAVVGHSFGAPLAVAWAAERPVPAWCSRSPVGMAPLQPAPGALRACRSTARSPRPSGCGRGRRPARRCRAGWSSAGSSACRALEGLDVPRCAADAARRGRAAPVVPGVLPALAIARPAGADRPRQRAARSSSGASSTAAAGRAARRWPRRSPARSSCCPASATCRCSRRRTRSRVAVAEFCRLRPDDPAARSDVWHCRGCGAPHDWRRARSRSAWCAWRSHGEDGFKLGSEGIEAERRAAARAVRLRRPPDAGGEPATDRGLTPFLHARRCGRWPSAGGRCSRRSDDPAPAAAARASGGRGRSCCSAARPSSPASSSPRAAPRGAAGRAAGRDRARPGAGDEDAAQMAHARYIELGTSSCAGSCWSRMAPDPC